MVNAISGAKFKPWIDRFAHVSGKQPFSAQTTTPFTRAKKTGTARQIFGTVLTILRHAIPVFQV